ncbi:quinolinate synthase NadA [Patescibacteria group bacterium]|nr:quinolinate synthase NadA [Patescibacteria group bacterium]MBU1016077.1 quinolinate synthase NadA [Patescibacteria group bacterium]MBU1938367.1 quinolinate synthase NadA [Patescibacteria group bacterium]
MFVPKQINRETERLFTKLERVGWGKSDCTLIAPLTLEINLLKRKKNAIILAHSYQTPDIMYGVADFLGDSYALSMRARETKANTIVFSSVHFMAETAKILNPKKTVLVPAVAGCSLAESITTYDVRGLKKAYPNAGVVCYINTTANVKAECDAVCTSGNALKIIERMPQKEIIFLPDEFMAKNLQPLTRKKLIGWKGRCIVHEEFSPKTVKEIRKEYPNAKILAHSECSPAVIHEADMMGSTKQMLDYVDASKNEEFMLVTECGLSDRVRVEKPGKKIVGSCALCPYMKKIMLKDILECLKSPRPEQIITLPNDIIKKAKKSLDLMIKLSK